MVATRRSSIAPAPLARPGTPSGGGGGGDIPRIPLLGVSPNVEAFDAAIDRRSDFYRLQALSHAAEHPPQQAPLLVREVFFDGRVF